MGKVFSCLSFKKRDGCTTKATREDPGRPERKNDVEKVKILDGASRRIPGLDLVNRTSQDACVWKLEDIEHDQYNSAHFETKRPSARNGLQKRITDQAPCSSSSGSAHVTNKTSVVSVLGDVTSSPPYLSKTDSQKHGMGTVQRSSSSADSASPLPRSDSRGSIPWTPVQAEASPRRRTMDSGAIPVSLRQANDDYTRRLTKQRSMTRALRDASRSPSPLPTPRYRLTTRCSTERTTADIDRSQGDIIKIETDSMHDTPSDTVGDKVRIHNSDVTNSGMPTSHLLIDNGPALSETNDIMVGDSLRQLEKEFYRAFPADSVALTPVPSFLKVTGHGEIPAILKEDNLKRLEDAFFREFPVDDKSSDSSAGGSETRGKEYPASKQTDDPKVLLKEDMSDFNEEECVDETLVAASVDAMCGIASTANDDTDPAVDEGEDSDEDSDDEDSSILVTLFEHTIEEEREEYENFCYSLLLQCIDVIDFGTYRSFDPLKKVKARNGISDHSKYHETHADNCKSRTCTPCIRRLNDDTDIIVAIDGGGIGHPVLRSRYVMIAIDTDGVGHPLVQQRGVSSSLQ